MSFAILRFEKIKSMADLAGMAGHWNRSRDTPNADPRAPEGAVRFLIGEDPVAEIQRRLPEKRRKDAVLCMEGMLSASPAYFRPEHPDRHGAYDPKRTDAWVKATMGWLKKEFGDRLASAVLHLDEATPHIQVAIVPLNRKTGRLDAKTQFGRGELRRFQTQYADALKHLGIRRGVEGSTATHQSVKRFYGIVNASQEPPELSLRDRAVLAVGKTTETVEHLLAQATDSRVVRDELQKANDRMRLLQGQLERERNLRVAAETARDAAVDQEKQARKVLADRVRHTPLPEILPLLGFIRVKHGDDSKWLGPAGTLTTGAALQKPAHFIFGDPEQKGRNAIDLVMAVLGVEFNGAIGWLARFLQPEQLSAELRAWTEPGIARNVKEAAAKPSPVLRLSDDVADRAPVEKTLLDQEIPSEGLFEIGAVGATRFARNLHAAFPLFKSAGTSAGLEPVGYLLEQISSPGRIFRFGAPGIWRVSNKTGFEGASQNVHVLTGSPREALALNCILQEAPELLIANADKIGRLIYFATQGADVSLQAEAVQETRRTGAGLILAYSGRQLEIGRSVAEEAKKQGVVVNSVMGIPELLSLNSFIELWLALVREGAQELLRRLAAARKARQQESIRDGRGRD